MKMKYLHSIALAGAIGAIVIVAGRTPPTPSETPIRTAQTASSFATHFTEKQLAQRAVRPSLTALQPSAELLAAMPPTPGNRALVAAHAEFVIQSIGELLGLPESQRPTYRDMLDNMYQAWLDDRLPEADVAKLVQIDRMQRVGQAGQPYNSLAATSLAPYLVEAGLCSGDPWSEQGLVCTYVDRDPGGPRITGSVRRGGTPEADEIRETPEGSALARILAASHNVPAATTASAATPRIPSSSLLGRAVEVAGSAVGAVCNVLIPSAYAQIAVPQLPAAMFPLFSASTSRTARYKSLPHLPLRSSRWTLMRWVC